MDHGSFTTRRKALCPLIAVGAVADGERVGRLWERPPGREPSTALVHSFAPRFSRLAAHWTSGRHVQLWRPPRKADRMTPFTPCQRREEPHDGLRAYAQRERPAVSSAISLCLLRWMLEVGL